jgi:endo-1,4-beta-mannosidase
VLTLRFRTWFLAFAAFAHCAAIHAALPKIRIAPAADNPGFVTEDGMPFLPFGVNYYRPGTGWAPQVWKQFDPDATDRDFQRLRELGGNCVRVFLTYGSFMTEPGVVNPEGLEKLDRFLELAEKNGLYVHPTGPDHWEGLPEWARGDRICSETVLGALEKFWETLATRLRGRNVVFAYDLLNEPEVPWDTPVLRERWNAWLTNRYASHAALVEAWGRQDVPEFGHIPPPPREDAPGDRRLSDFQRFREDMAEIWTSRQVAAIRRADPDALVTIGSIQWSVPIVIVHVAHYSAFRPDRQAPHLDFLSFHFYPFAEGTYRYEGRDAERRNLAYLDAVAREFARWKKPVVIGEFAWYGGGLPRWLKDGEPASEEDQARWCRLVVEQTRGQVQGWLNWGLHDQPEATDPSQFTGLLRADGTPKAWAREFQSLAQSLSGGDKVRPRVGGASAPELNWDLLVTSRAEVDRFRQKVYEAFDAGEEPAK